MTWLYISRWIDAATSETRKDIRDAHQDGYGTGRTSCGIHRYPALRPANQLRIVEDSGMTVWLPMYRYLDCPCDVRCPRCDSPATSRCYTLDGGGKSGGGWPTRWHAVRVKASPRCQGLLDGTRSYCDWGWHAWQPAGTTSRARCLLCQTEEPLHDPCWEELETERRRWAAEQIAVANAEAERRAGVVRLADRQRAKEESQ